ncbi:site-specific integrase [Vibrio parahaemolyticus]|uniref:tyrosine-type recombinase/integrase n=1 Tax=Vibrio parahaemolyticus TaxID=670 RepID=UPI001D16CBEF|nr:site-specific integrase [Vibrio parahaemolyticus]MCC3859116.1 site-specific integrase [Vibrio parahaemolyticus]
MAKLIRATVNLGTKPYFCRDKDGEYVIDEDGYRQIAYMKDEIINNFPLIYSPNYLDITCEFNLFLAHRYLGEYAVKRNNTSGRSVLAESEGTRATARGKRISLDTVEKIAKDLLSFMNWIEKQKNIDLEVLWSEPTSDSLAAYSTHPIWQYRNEIYDIVENKVEGKTLSHGSGCNYVNVVRHWYEWSRKNHRIDNLPFEYVKKVIRRQTSGNADDSMSNMLFGMAYTESTPKGGIPVWAAQISLPQKLTQKQNHPDDELQPYSQTELAQLMSSDIVKDNDTYHLFVKVAYICALRTFEIVKLNQSDIVNPAEDIRPYYRVLLLKGKGAKDRWFRIPPELMTELWNYTNTLEYIKRRVKFEINYPVSEPVPVFINKSGHRMTAGSVRNTISKVRLEQRQKNEPVLKRTFHDLKATSLTYLAIYLLRQGMDEGLIKVKLMAHGGHNNWNTTKRYLDFAKDDLYDVPMQPWVESIYSQVDKALADVDPTLELED